MVSDRPLTPCPACGEPVEPDEFDVVEAVEIVPVAGFGAPSDTAEGMGAVFHAACWRDDNLNYRRL